MITPRRQRILLVEDDRTTAAVTKRLLVTAGYQVTVADNGVQALARLRAQEPDMIASDICMPNMDGIEFLLTVRANPNWRQISFIFITGKGSVGDLRAALQGGANDYLIKPFLPKELLRVVAAALQRQSRAVLTAETGEGVDARPDASSKHATPVEPIAQTRVLVKENGAIFSLGVNDIDRVESTGNYLTIFAAGKRHMLRKTLSAFQHESAGQAFHKISRSNVVRIKLIRRIILSPTGRKQIVLQDGTLLTTTLSRATLSALLRA